MTRTISAEVTDAEYERFQKAKDQVGGTNTDALVELLSRYNGKRRDRPPTLLGSTQRINYPKMGNSHGKCYVNINVDAGSADEDDPVHPEDLVDMDPFEVFITVGDSGTIVNSWAEALSKTLSNALRAGVDPMVLADDLKGIRGPYTPALDNGDDIYSVPDGVGIAIQRFVEGKVDPPESVRGSLEMVGVED